MSRIALNQSSYSSLLSLQRVSSVLNSTQQILATGKKVNSAIDNPSSYYTARSLNNRAADLSSLLDNMGQKIQTIKAASEGITAATSFLEQMTSVAEQAIENPLIHQDEKTLLNDGYTVIDSSMTTSQISALITDGAKIALSSDITLDDTLTITAQNISFNGNGHTITFAGSGSALTATKAAIEVTGEGASADFKNIKIEASGDWAVGISARNHANITIDNTYGINMTGENSFRISNRDELLYAGKYNTYTTEAQIGADGLATRATTQFYAPGVSADDETFGQGNWYLPSFGELLDVYGYDKEQIPSGTTEEERKMGAIGDNKKTINDSLKALRLAGADAAELTNSWYWSSSEYNSYSSWLLNMNNGIRLNSSKYNKYYVRSFQLLKDCFNPLPLSADHPEVGGSGGLTAPQIGDVMYSDKTWGKAADYDGTKTAVGVITNVSADGRDVTIMSLKNLRFKTVDEANNFEPTTPYTGAQAYSRWATDAAKTTDITGMKNYTYALSSAGFKSEGTITVSNTLNRDIYVGDTYTAQYDELVSQYDDIANDSGYKGINLLKGDSMEVIFNESRDNKLEVQGTDISSAAIGLNTVDWRTIDDVMTSIKELKIAVATLRTVASDLGNHNAIIQTRQEFTENLINILEEGADKLTLADMNEASADMLSLQTRQQLAINALSLATQAEQNVLKLF